SRTKTPNHAPRAGPLPFPRTAPCTRSQGVPMTTSTTRLHPRAAAVASCALALTTVTALAQPGRLVPDIDATTTAQSPSSPPRFVGGDDRHAIIVVDDTLHGLEAWITDGTPDGTHLIADTVPGPAAGVGTWLGRVGDRIIFAAGHGIYAS